ncbi:hypothetical protein [Nocardia sp. NPDC050435]|uniref:hypothetical protein n=1 Tax=Nocardia sp. NPDC050435 TaxID=3155040 RepID=UPI0033D1A597
MPSQSDARTEPQARPRPAPAEVWRQWLGEAPELALPEPISATAEATTPTPAPIVDDDPMAPIVEDMRRRQAARRHRLSSRRVLGVAAALVAVAGGGGALVAVNGDSPSTAAGVATASPTPAMVPAAAVATPSLPAWCAPTATDTLVVGSDPGNHTSGPGVILLQQHALYVLRDVAAVRSVFAPDALAASEEATRAAIAAIPAGTRHCVTITPAGPARWSVQISEQRPDGASPTWQQTVTTTTGPEGQVLISAITAGSN